MFPDPAGKMGKKTQSSPIWSRTTPPWTNKLSPNATETSGRVRARFNSVACKLTALWDHRLSWACKTAGLILSQTGSGAMQRAALLQPQGEQWLGPAVPPQCSWCWGQVGCRTRNSNHCLGVLLHECCFMCLCASCFWSYLSCWQNLYPHEGAEIQGISRLSWVCLLNMFKLQPVPMETPEVCGNTRIQN